MKDNRNLTREELEAKAKKQKELAAEEVERKAQELGIDEDTPRDVAGRILADDALEDRQQDLDQTSPNA